MMVFLARSALCIGLVAAAASGVGAGRVVATVDRGARHVLEGAGRACLASADCLEVGTAALSTAAGSGAPPIAAAPRPVPTGSGQRTRAPRRPGARVEPRGG